jgi:hypothetical protein
MPCGTLRFLRPSSSFHSRLFHSAKIEIVLRTAGPAALTRKNFARVLIAVLDAVRFLIALPAKKTN